MDNKTLAARALFKIKDLGLYKAQDIAKAAEQLLKNNYYKLENAGVNKLAEVKDINKAKEALLKWIEDRNKNEKSLSKSWGIDLEALKRDRFKSGLSFKQDTPAAREKIRLDLLKKERENAVKAIEKDKNKARIEHNIDTYKSDLMNGNIPQEIKKRFNLMKPSPLKNNTFKKVSTPKNTKKTTPQIKKTLKNFISRFTSSS